VTIATIQQIIRRLREEGIAILITDHQVRETLQITDRSYVIRAGQVLCHGRPEEVLSNPDARRYYFGDDIEIGHQRPPAPHHGIHRRRPAHLPADLPADAEQSN
jgi:lipopolysaccharide export system ATP-binding protein